MNKLFIIYFSIIAICLLFVIAPIVDYVRYGEDWQLLNNIAPHLLNVKPMPERIIVKQDISIAIKTRDLGVRTVSAYNPIESQTDGNPCVGARNINICDKLNQGENVCATWLAPIGTKLKIGNIIVCTVYDRTSKKYKDRVDVMFPGNMVDEALSFGTKNLLIQRIY